MLCPDLQYQDAFPDVWEMGLADAVLKMSKAPNTLATSAPGAFLFTRLVAMYEPVLPSA
jgi:hypothetical protein